MAARIVILLLLSGCATQLSRATVFYDADQPQLLDLNGKQCRQSGVVVTDTKFRTYYRDCDVIIERDLTEKDLRQWGR